jgi:hypothetical protein
MSKEAVFSCLVISLLFACACRGEFAVNTRTSQDQKCAAVAVDGAGNSVVVWSSYYNTERSNEIFGQRFGADGARIGGELVINSTTAGNQTEASVAMDAAGNFVVAWQGPAGANEDIFARRFDANGQALGDEFRVNTITGSRQLCPGVAMNNDGNCVIVWESMDIPEEGKRAICGQLYDSSGSEVGAEFVVNDEPSTCRHPDIAMHSSGRFIVVWVRESTLNSIWVRHFDANGSPPYLSSKVNDDFNFTSLTRPAVAIDANGNYVIVWDGHPESYLEDDVYLRRYHWSHVPLHQQFRVNTYQAGAQSNPSVAMNDDGRFIVVWQSDTATGGTAKDILGQRFPGQGEHIGEPILTGDQFRVNTYLPNDQRCPAAAMSNSGRFIIVWESRDQDGSGYGVFGEMGPKAGSADVGEDGFVDFSDYCVLGEEWRKEENPLEADLIDDNKIDEQDLAAFCLQWLRPCYECGEVDVYTDGKIDFKDYARWAANRGKLGPGLAGDIDGNGIVGLSDLKALVFHWLKGCEQ